jgi:hypothetical protein
LVAAFAFAASPTALTSGAVSTTPPQPNPALGSVISSFQMTAVVAPYALGIVRDNTYVYGVLYNAANSGYLRSYTPAGSVVGSVAVSGTGTVRDGDTCDLGASYCSLIWVGSGAAGIVTKNVLATGSQVNSFAVSAPSTQAMDIAYLTTNGYYAIGCGYSGTSVSMYTTAGASAGTWSTANSGFTYCGGLAWSATVNNATGSYVMFSSWTAGQGHTVLSYPSGAVVGSANWGIVGGGNCNGSCCGLGAPTTYGTTFWANMYNGSTLNAYQYDLGNTAGAITPASLGKVKSLYR